MKLSCSLLILLTAVFLMLSEPFAAQVSPHPPSVARDTFIHQIMEDAGIPGLQAVVVKRDKIVWSHSYGDAVLDVPGPRRPMNEHDLILTASTTKLCVTVAALQQLEKGKFALDDDISRSLPFPVRNPNWPDVPITWRMLLTHTSSIAETTDDLIQALSYWGKDHPLAFDDYVKARFLPGGKYHAYELFRPGKPGSERIYSNDGFSLLAFAIEQVTHESFDIYAKREIWTPLKMNETSYSLAGLSPDHLAVGYGAQRRLMVHFRLSRRRYFGGMSPRVAPLWTIRTHIPVSRRKDLHERKRFRPPDPHVLEWWNSRRRAGSEPRQRGHDLHSFRVPELGRLAARNRSEWPSRFTRTASVGTRWAGARFGLRALRESADRRGRVHYRQQQLLGRIAELFSRRSGYASDVVV